MKKTADRRPLNQTELEECLALKKEISAFNERRPRGERLTQEGISHELGMSQGTLSSHLNGARAINKEMAAKMASLLEITVERFSPRLAGEIRGMAESIADPALADRQSPKESSAAAIVLDMLKGKNLSTDQLSRIQQAVVDTVENKPLAQGGDNVVFADFSRPGRVGDEVWIPHYDIRAAMGGGQVPHDYPEILQDIRVSPTHLREMGVEFVEHYHLKLVTGWGQSMAPTIKHRDPLLVDVSIREFNGDGIYLFSWGDHLYIKRLQIADDEYFDMISDNKQHKDRQIRQEETYIQAKVLLVWNAQLV